MNFIIDLHCHPDLKPFGRSFTTDEPAKNSSDPKAKASIWKYDPPTTGDRIGQRLFGLCKFSQSDFTTLSSGNVRCICTSLYSIEKKFVDFNIIGQSSASDFVTNLVSSISRERINFIQQANDYFSDLVSIYNYYLELHNQEIKSGGIKRKYVLIKNFNDLEQAIALNEGDLEVQTVYVIMSIEGMHVLNSGLDHTANENEILENLKTIKNWEFKPFFVTLAHHFYNEFCGHAESITGGLQDFLTSQEFGMKSKITDLGWKVIKGLLDNSNGKRIHIDIKHMNAVSRKEYIDYIKSEHSDEYALKKLPIIISHGACNGLISATNPNYTHGLQKTASRMFKGDINFYDDEIIELAKSGGIIGLQLDERRIASREFKQSLRLTLGSSHDRCHSNSKMLWNNIQHILQLLDMNDIFAWDCIAIGSDFDGLIDPINMFWTSEDMDDLIQYTERHAFNYLNEPTTVFKNDFNRIEPSEIVKKIFHYNAYEFFRRNFN